MESKRTPCFHLLSKGLESEFTQKRDHENLQLKKCEIFAYTSAWAVDKGLESIRVPLHITLFHFRPSLRPKLQRHRTPDVGVLIHNMWVEIECCTFWDEGAADCDVGAGFADGLKGGVVEAEDFF